MRHRKRLVILAALLLTASAPTTNAGCVDNSTTGPSCREEGRFCLADSECCSGYCRATNMMDPSGECS
jgi:hypothetical protein